MVTFHTFFPPKLLTWQVLDSLTGALRPPGAVFLFGMGIDSGLAACYTACERFMSEINVLVTEVQYESLGTEPRLLERLQEQGSLALTEACALTGASVATTRRDFELLQEKGLAQRTHGGLQLPKKEEPKGYLQGTAILNHTDEEKYRIAQEAAASVKAGESVFLGAGKTCNMLASCSRTSSA